LPPKSRAMKRIMPFRLKRWTTGTAPSSAFFFTCARPGRSNREKSRIQQVPDDLVHRWVFGLPGPNTAIVSLLGRKGGPEGLSEFSFYTFCGGLDTPLERGKRPSFQKWIEHHHKDLEIKVHEHPTFDFCQIPSEALAAVAADIKELLSEGRTVVVVDSGGITRTNQVCKYMGATEDSRTA